MWRRNALLRLMPPLPWTRKRLAAPLFVFIFGITATPSWMTPGGLAALQLTTTSLVLRSSILARGRAACSVHCLFLRREHHDHLTTFHLGKLLDHRVRVEVRAHALQQLHTEFLVRHFPTAETQRHLRLVTFFQNADQVAQLDLIIAFIRTGPELDFLDLNLPLLELRLVALLRFSILELAVVHDPADRRFRRRGNLH